MNCVGRRCEVAVGGGEGETLMEGGGHPHRLEALSLQPLNITLWVRAL